MNDDLSKQQRAWRIRIFVITWLGYAGFYLCRKNFSVIMPELKILGFTEYHFATILALYSLLYAIGQFVNGVLSDRFGPRLIVGAGLFISIFSNVIMGFGYWGTGVETRSPLLQPAEIKAPTAFVSELKTADDPFEQYLKERLSNSARQSLDAYDPTSPPSASLLESLVNEINRLFENGDLISVRLNRYLIATVLEDSIDEKNEHYPVLEEDDIKKPDALIVQIQQRNHPLAQWLYAQLPEDTQQQINAYDDSNPPSDELLELLIEGLNQTILHQPIHNNVSFDEEEWTAIASRVKAWDDSISRYLYTLLPEAAVQALSDYESDEAPPSEVLRTHLTATFNEALTHAQERGETERSRLNRLSFDSFFTLQITTMVAPFILVLMILYPLNGAGQSTGWSGLVKNMAFWFRRKERGIVMAWWGTNYVLGGFIATNFATYCVYRAPLFPELGWKRGFWFPAILLSVIWLAFIILTRNKPADVGVPEIVKDDIVEPKSGADLSEFNEKKTKSSMEIFLEVISVPSVWLISIMYFFLKLTRYAFLFWLPLYMKDHLGYGGEEAGYTSSIFELVGFMGAVAAGYFSDKLFQSRRMPVGALMLWGLAIAFLIHPHLAAWSHLGNAIGIALIGFMTFGPDTLMTGAAAQDVGSKHGAATAAGFINGIGSIGQTASGYVVAYVTLTYGWDSLFYLFVIFAFIGGSLLALKWNYNALVEEGK